MLLFYMNFAANAADAGERVSGSWYEVPMERGAFAGKRKYCYPMISNSFQETLAGGRAPRSCFRKPPLSRMGNIGFP